MPAAARDSGSGEFPPFAVTVDIAVFTIRDDALQVLLIERGEEPFLGAWALPGGFVHHKENLDRAAERELEEETGVRPGSWHLEQLASYGEPNRDPRMRTVTVAYWAICSDLPAPRGGGDAANAALVPVERSSGGRSSWHSTTGGSCATPWNGRGRSLSTPLSQPDSVRPSSPSASFGGCSRPSGTPVSTRATSSGTSRSAPPSTGSRGSRHRPGADARPRSGPWGTRPASLHPSRGRSPAGATVRTLRTGPRTALCRPGNGPSHPKPHLRKRTRRSRVPARGILSAPDRSARRCARRRLGRRNSRLPIACCRGIPPFGSAMIW